MLLNYAFILFSALKIKTIHWYLFFKLENKSSLPLGLKKNSALDSIFFSLKHYSTNINK